MNDLKRFVSEFDSRNKGIPPHFENDGDNTLRLDCPMCGFESVHHSGIAVIVDSVNIVRGSVVAIPMFCEDGCSFVLCHGFHKGGIYTWCIPVPKCLQWGFKPTA